jgi:hypothetical protein
MYVHSTIMTALTFKSALAMMVVTVALVATLLATVTVLKLLRYDRIQ